MIVLIFCLCLSSFGHQWAKQYDVVHGYKSKNTGEEQAKVKLGFAVTQQSVHKVHILIIIVQYASGAQTQTVTDIFENASGNSLFKFTPLAEKFPIPLYLVTHILLSIFSIFRDIRTLLT